VNSDVKTFITGENPNAWTCHAFAPNVGHDLPQRVIYERKGPGLLLAATEGTYKGKEEREEFQMRKARCNPKDE
jgi:hypothetical protein